ncbi:MAG: VWA domain-containing protein, partial [Flavobacteriales bacterium]
MSRNASKYNIGWSAAGLIIWELLFWGIAVGTWLYLNYYVPSFRFEKNYVLWGLGLVPLLLIAFLVLLRWKNKAIERYGDSNLVGYLMPGISTFRSSLKFFFIRNALFFLIIALANPQFGTKKKEAKTKGIDIMVALDLSKSMLAEDLKPSRLEKAKRALEKLIERLRGDRVGIIVFGGEAYVQLPITSDHSSAKLFLSNISTEIIPVQGT